jgi:type 2 lantibiotic biosynthesis protein LanM
MNGHLPRRVSLHRALSASTSDTRRPRVFAYTSAGGKISDSFTDITAWLQSSAPIGEADPPPPGPAVPFAELWQRLAAAAMDQLAEPQAEIRADLTADLVARLSAVGEATLWAEFNTRRRPRDVVIEHLRPGGPGRAIYCSFLEELRNDGLRSLTARYPVLRRHLATTVRHWREANRELLTRVRADRGLLADAFGVPAGAQLAGVQQGLSDPHRGGRTVAALTFTHSGDRRHIMYKPKDLRLDRAFQQLLAKVPRPTLADTALRSIAVLPRNGYGYMEWVPHVLCDGDRQLRCFYRNAGRLAAVLYLLSCADCHHENFVAQGDQLLLVDGEALFQGTPCDRNTDRRQSVVRSGLYDRMSDSVVRLGLLPQWHFAGAKRIPQDVSALGIAPPRSAQQEEIGWVKLGTDGMIAGRVERATGVPTSSPVGVGSRNRLSDFAGDFCGGFEAQLVAISAEKRRWLGNAGYLARFKHHRSRFVRRATWVYLWALKQQTEPEALASESGQRRVRAKLGRDRVPFLARPADPRVVAAEAAQLDDLDVPFFEQPVDEIDLIAPDGSTIPGYFEMSGYDSARRKLEQLDTAAIDLQIALIRGVIAAKDMHAHRPPRRDPSASGRRLDEPSSAERRSEAAAIGDVLVSTAISDDTGAVEWLGIDVAEDTERSSYRPLGLSLYAGRTGIALFLAALARGCAARSDTYARTAMGACSDLNRVYDGRNTVEDGRGWWREQPLGLAGGGGVLLALVHLRGLLPAVAHQADRVTSFLLDALDPDVLASDKHLDVIFGCAGLIGPLLAIGTPRALALARAAGDALVEGQDGSGGWVTRSSGDMALTGFSHGASGMAAALVRLHSATGCSDYLDAAAAAISWERRRFDPAAGNWPDLRGNPEPAKARFMLSWCHGAPGIALARLCLAGTALWDSSVEEELHRALESTANQTLPEDSLCCGRFGRAAILRMAARQAGERRWLEAAIQLEAQCLERRRATGSYSFQDVPGLFQGTAGVGLALLDENGWLMPAVLSAGLHVGAKDFTEEDCSTRATEPQGGWAQ